MSSIRANATLFASITTMFAAAAAAPTATVPLTAADWEGTDSVRVESYLGRPSLYINRGVALARGVTLENGTIDYHVAATSSTSFLGIVFRARSPRFSEVILLRPRQSGTIEAVQYAPAFNNVAAAWMTSKVAGTRIVYARATIDAPRDELRRMQYSYSDGVVVYLNGRPLVFAMSPAGLRDDLAIMARTGDAVYLPLRRGRNEIVFAVIEHKGGWAFGARLDPD